MMERKIKILKGRQKTFDMFIQNEQGQPQDLTNHSLIRLGIPYSNGCIKKYAPKSVGVNEVQRLSLSGADAGSFNLAFKDEVTPALPFDVSAAQIQTALNDFFELSGVTVAEVLAGEFDITFAGDDGSREQALIKVDESSLELGGNSVAPSVVETTVGKEVTGIEVVEEKAGHIRIFLSTDDVALLDPENDQSIDLYIRIGTLDLDLDPALLREVLDVEEIPCVN